MSKPTSRFNGSGSTTSSMSSSFSQTLSFSSPVVTATPTDSGQGGGGGGGGGGGPGSGPNANLYLYTFLATLVLLLGVSGAIIVRSLLLRRRHRRMVEEAIANGTWIPPAPRIKVDLRKKPKLWDAYVSPPPGAGEGKEWDRVMPFAASYARPPAPSRTPSSHNLASAAAVSSPSLSPNTATSPHSLAPAFAGDSAAAIDSAGLVQPRVRVAVLIAMPSRDGSALYPLSGAASSSSSSTHPLDAAPAPAWRTAPVDDEDEAPLPYLEVGLVHVGVVSAADADDESGEDGEGGKRRGRS
ncbi:hypothetical protein C8J57DRAFT_1273470 [Mycena rebaudengoi]|nr:hypothetical protein C8J57DRAFT_1273470 [Mycena rebaudengoi]